MSPSWSIFITVTLLLLQLCTGEKSCVIWSSAGAVVQRNSDFKVYCSFNCKCERLMYSGQPPMKQKHRDVNSTTVYINVVNITEKRTFSCSCDCQHSLDPCGLDISVGYPPDDPRKILCIYKVMNNESGDVRCTWERGRETHLMDSSQLRLTTVSGNHTSKLENVFRRGSKSLSCSVTVPRSVQQIHVWVQTENPLGTAVSSVQTYSLSDIATPPAPVLVQPVCSSQRCIIEVEQRVLTEHLEIQYNDGKETWTSYQDQDMVTGTLQKRSVSSLEPYTLYYFRARCKFSTGRWSEWSTNVSSWTEEEPPTEGLDVWYAESATAPKTPRVYWKQPDKSSARGKIIEYRVRVYSPDSGTEQVINVPGDVRTYSPTTCDKCEVTVWARNSKGLSPPASVRAPQITESSQDVTVITGKQNVTTSWRMLEMAARHSWFVLEWYPEGQKLEELRWTRLNREANHAVITGVQPFVCYKGALYVFFNQSSASRTEFGGITAAESIPKVGPSVQMEITRHTLKLSWTELPRDMRGGCITKYTIYLKTSSGHQLNYSTPTSPRRFKVKDLPPSEYNLWMTASTAEGEGPVSQGLRFLVQEETSISFIFVFCGICSVLMLLLCLYQIPSVKQKFWVYFQCLMLDVIPDPANSKWAKECTREKGTIKLQLQMSSSVSQGEPDPDLVDIVELSDQSSNICNSTNAFSQKPSHMRLGQRRESSALLYPVTTYIKSFSHESDSSDHTQTSLETNTTVDYISTQGLGNMEEEEEEEEEWSHREDEEMLNFFPSLNMCMEPMGIGGGHLTLDTVKIDFCSDFFQNN